MARAIEYPYKIFVMNLRSAQKVFGLMMKPLIRLLLPHKQMTSTTSIMSDSPSALKKILLLMQFMLATEDMIVLSGAHSIGEAQCTQIEDRLYKYSEAQPQDPSLDPTYADELARKCPAPDTLPAEQALRTMVDFDPTTPLDLDNQYYVNLMRGRGLLQSDKVLTTDPQTGAIVYRMAASSETWSKKFLKAMIKMGRINVLTKDEGEIRTNCRAYL